MGPWDCAGWVPVTTRPPGCGKVTVTHKSSASEGPKHMHLARGWRPVCSEAW